MTETFELYFDDLNEDSKKRFLEFERVESESGLNHEISPICIIEREFED